MADRLRAGRDDGRRQDDRRPAAGRPARLGATSTRTPWSRPSTGSTVPELFAARGEAAFRAEESRVLAEAVDSPTDRRWCRSPAARCCRPANRALLRRPASWSGCGPTRPPWPPGWATAPAGPLLGRRPGRPALAALDAVRRPLYEEVADVVVDVDDLDPPTVVDRHPGRRPAVRRGAGRDHRGPGRPGRALLRGGGGRRRPSRAGPGGRARRCRRPAGRWW